MKKNGQYVGVDEKYIPEDETYVDDTINSELKNYIGNKENRQKIKKIGKNVLIGYIIFGSIIFIIALIIIIFVLKTIFSIL